MSDRTPPRPDAIVAAVQKHAQRLSLPAWPVFGLPNAEAAGWLGGSSEDERGVRAIRIDYYAPSSDQRLIVQTQPATGLLPDLGAVIDQLRESEDTGEPLGLFPVRELGAPSPDPTEDFLVGGLPVAGIGRRGQAFSAFYISTRGVAVLVAARGPTPVNLVLQQIEDLAPFQQRRQAIVADLLHHTSPG